VKEKIGKYQLLEQIGVGGFGEVFKAFDPLIKRYVALKTCNSSHEEIRSRFFQEAEIAGNLQHRNITTVYDFGVEDGLPYLVQEYLSGEDLDRKIKRRDPISFSHKLGWLLQLARGLGAAHAAGVIHRDIKPANVRVLDDGTAKIMDFGIAKLIQQENGLTQTGMTIGTAAYLSPEQVRGDAVNAHTDVFSFGVLAYELLTYSRPFEGREISAVLYQVLHAEPRPLTEVWPAAPPGVTAILRRCLDKTASKRYLDGSDLARDLERLNSQLGAAKELDNAALTMPLEQLERKPADGLPPAGQQVAAPAFPAAPPHPAAQGFTPPPPPPPTTPRPNYARQESPPASPSYGAGLPLGRPSRSLRSGLDSLELSGSSPIAARERALGHKERKFPLPLLIVCLVIALVLVAALGGWMLGRKGQEPAAASKPLATASQPTTQASPSSVAPTQTAPTKAAPTQTATPAQTAPTQTPATKPAEPAPQPAEPEKPKPPASGSITISAPGWTDAMVVTLGKRAYRLDSDRRLELQPGTYNFVFELNDEGYRVSIPRRVEVRAGQDGRLAIPIPEPGQLSVRPLPRRPSGDVYLDNEALGTTLVRRKIAPGTHQLEIRGRDNPAATLVRTLQIESGRETVVSFDLEKLEAQIILK